MSGDVLLRKLELAQAVIMGAYDFARAVKAAYPPKKIFQKIDRTPGKRKRKAMKKLAAMLSASMTRARMQAIVSQPLPRYNTITPSAEDMKTNL